MSKGTVNKVILIGRLGADPDVRYMPSGDAITKIRMATDSQWKDRNTGQMQEATEWHNVTFFGKLGEIAGQYLRKGSKAYIEGRIRTNKWQDQSGQDRYTTEIIGDQMQMLDSKSSSSGVGGNEYESAPTSRPSPPPPRPQTSRQPPAPPPTQYEPPPPPPNYDEENAYNPPPADFTPRKFTPPTLPNQSNPQNQTSTDDEPRRDVPF